MTNISQMGTAHYVVFSVNHQLYSVLIEEVIEILRIPTIASIPGINEIIEGVINLRGNIIPVVNLHKRFNLLVLPRHKKNRIVIVQVENENIGIMVDDVRMVTMFDEENVEPTAGQTLDEDMFIGFAKLDNKVIGILNLKKVLYEYD